MAKRVDPHQVISDVQPLNWSRAVVVGMIGALFMMGFIDIFNMLGITPFSFEVYLGSLIRGEVVGAHNWTVGFFANLVCGAFFGIFYAYCFEYVFFKATPRLGFLLGLAHAAIAAIAFFPFFNIAHEQMGTELYPHFGILGAALGAPTFFLLLIGHLLFGATMGTLYGPVRADRVLMRDFEPGESGSPGDRGVISETEDPSDRAAV